MEKKKKTQKKGQKGLKKKHKPFEQVIYGKRFKDHPLGVLIA